MPTTGGALAFKGFVPPYEATITTNLREAGAVVIAKTNMTELANWIATGMPGNYNAIAGYGFNPYDPRADPARGHRTTARTRIERRRLELGRGHCREFLGGECGHGDIRFDPDARQPDDARRDQADGRARQPLRHHSDHSRSGHGRAHGQNRGRCGAAARCPRRPRAGSSRSRAEGVSACRRTATTRAFSIRKGSRALVSDCPFRLRRRSAPRRGGERGDHGASAARRHRHRPVDASAGRRRCVAIKPDARGKDTDCSIVFKYGMKRDFNRWLASLGRLAGENADGAARVEPCAPRRRRHQVRSGSARYFRRGRSRARSCSLSRRPRDRRPA